MTKVRNGKDNFIKDILCDETSRCSCMYTLLEEAAKASDLESEGLNFDDTPFLKAIREDENSANIFWWLFDYSHSSNHNYWTVGV